MQNWKMLAAAMDPPVPEEAVAPVNALAETLEARAAEMPIDTLPWTAAE